MKYLEKGQNKVLFVATVVKKHIMEFHVPCLKMFKGMGWETAVAAGNDYENPADCVIPYCDCYYDISFERSPLRIRNVRAYLELKRLIDTENYDIIHCHTPVGGILARFAARDARKKGVKVIYTAHGFHFYKGAPLLNWMFFYPVEWACSWWTDVLITINKEDYRLAKRRFHAKRTEYVHGVGINVSKFRDGLIDVEEKRRSLNLHKDDIMLLSVGELSKRKNHEVVIRAIAQLQIPQLKYFICGTGKLQEELTLLTDKLKLQKQVFLLGYRDDISELCQAADLYIFLSKQEGFPVAVMEAIACKTPVLCSDIGGSNDLMKDKGCMFDAGSAESVAECIADKLGRGIDGIWNGSNQRVILPRNMKYAVEQNYRNLKKYGLQTVSNEMVEIYWGLRRLWYRKCFEKKWCFDGDVVVLLSIGELNKNKNHSVIIQALAEMNNPQIHYFIAGSGKLKEKLERLSKKLGIEKQVHLLGYRNDIRYLLQVADIYLLPSKREGLNVSLMEAMASGVPCIASKIRGNVDLISNGKCLVGANDAEGWKHAVKNMIFCIQNNQINFVKKNNRRIEQYDRVVVNSQMKKIYKSK